MLTHLIESQKVGKIDATLEMLEKRRKISKTLRDAYWHKEFDKSAVYVAHKPLFPGHPTPSP